jgi:chromosome partitioning protein
MKTLLITNRKGGVGKTTTTLNIAYEFVKRGKKTLIVDLDTQGHIQYGLGITDEYQGGVHTLLQNEKTNIRDFIQKTSIKKLHFLPADINYNSSLLQNKKSLKKVLKRISSKYDICIIDTAPMSDTLLEMAMLASDYVIVPMKTEYLGLLGTTQFIKMFYQISSKLKTDFQLLGILPTLYNKSMREHNRVIEELEQIVGKTKVLHPIRKDAVFTNIFREGIEITSQKHSRASQDYKAVVDSFGWIF